MSCLTSSFSECVYLNQAWLRVFCYNLRYCTKQQWAKTLEGRRGRNGILEGSEIKCQKFCMAESNKSTWEMNEYVLLLLLVYFPLNILVSECVCVCIWGVGITFVSIPNPEARINELKEWSICITEQDFGWMSRSRRIICTPGSQCNFNNMSVLYTSVTPIHLVILELDFLQKVKNVLSNWPKNAYEDLKDPNKREQIFNKLN